LKLLIFIFYYWILRASGIETLNKNIVCTILLTPFLISVIAIYSPYLEELIRFIWKNERYPGEARYGGIYGDDVNSFGMYAALTIIYFFAAFPQINRSLFLGGIALLIFCVLVTGLRTGAIAMIFAFIITLILSPEFRKRYAKKFVLWLFILTIFITIAGSTVSIINLENPGFAFIKNTLMRFSVDALLADVSTTEGGNLSHALSYLSHQQALYQKFSTSLDPLIGLSSQFGFVDSLFVDVYFRHGLVVAVLLVVFLLSPLFSTDPRIKFITIFTFLVGIKGLFPFANYFIFMICLISIPDKARSFPVKPIVLEKNFRSC
jgi:hypothetical protein